MGTGEIEDALGGELFPEVLLHSTDVQSLIGTISQVLDETRIALFWKDREGRFLAANNVFSRVCGLEDPTEIIGKTDFDLFDHDVATRFSKDDAEVIETGLPILDYTEELSVADGRKETLHTSKVPVRDNSGEIIAVMCCFHVVTTLIETTQALRTLEGRYAVALDASRDGMWELDLRTDQLEVSSRFAELLELDPDLHRGRRFDRDEIDQVLGDDLGTISREIQQVIDGKSVLSFNHERRMPDGSVRWFHVSGLPFAHDEVKISHVIGTLVDITEQVRRERELIYTAGHDDLTGLHNRRSLLQYLSAEMRQGTPFSLLYLDLDEFKVVNDSLGHDVGDKLLSAMADRLGTLTRPGQMAARLGGDEFAILLPNITPRAAEDFGQQVIDELSQLLLLDETEFYVTCSIGVVHSNDSYGSALEVLRDGDTALYSAKRDGKSCTRTFEPAMRVAADEALAIQNQIRGAVERNEFVMHYQPIFDSGTESITGVEALMRWQRPDGELLTADTFLPYLEHTGLMVRIGEWVVRESIGQLGSWLRQHPHAHDLSLSVNLSRTQFRSPRVCEVIFEALAEHDVAHRSLIVEVTETAIAENSDLVVEILDELRSQGVRVAIDDFGVGQSSLSALHNLPADMLKIDGSFVSKIRPGAPEPMIDAMLVIAKSMGLATTAEGVETEAQFRYLKDTACDRLQGFLFGSPMPADQLADLLLQQFEQDAA